MLRKTRKNKVLNVLLLISTMMFIIGASATEPNIVSVSVMMLGLLYIFLFEKANNDDK